MDESGILEVRSKELGLIWEMEDMEMTPKFLASAAE
jgi:hypothetical protein